MAKRKSSGHGGYRPGAGRPRALEDEVLLTVKIERRHKDMLDRTAKERGVTLSAVVREILEMFAKFTG